jgi:hypothetical protein
LDFYGALTSRDRTIGTLLRTVHLLFPAMI